MDGTDSRRAVLAVFAHPDDESLACGGTLARLADAGVTIIVMCASRGERGSATGPARDDVLAERRTTEAQDAAKALGVAHLIILDHPDGDLRWAHVAELHAEIVMAVRRFNPAAVITFGKDGLYWHRDHVGIYERTTTAVRSLGDNAPPLYYVTMPRGAMRGIVERAKAGGWVSPAKGFWSLVPDAFGLQAETPTLVVDVADWTSRKLAAIRCHRTQTGAADPFDRIDEADARCWLGVEHFHRALGDRFEAPILEQLGRSVVG